jgi:hypothetical protein
MASIEMIKYHGQIDSKNAVVKCEEFVLELEEC